MELFSPCSKFQDCKEKIREMEEHNPRFRRVYSEFNAIVEEIRQMKRDSEDSVPDDFWWALETQKALLEEEIEHWLRQENTAEV